MRNARTRATLWTTTVVLALFVGLSPAPAHGQTLAGFVIDQTSQSSVPLAKVTVMDLDSVPLAVTLTDMSGYFTVEVREAGWYLVSAESEFHEGYAGGPLSLTEGDTASVAFRLIPRPVELEGLVVEARARAHRMIRGGYLQRINSGRGWHLDRDEIQRRARFRISEALRAIPTVRFIPSGYGNREPVFGGWRNPTVTSGGSCYPRVYVDGILFSPGGEMPSEIDKAFPPDQVEAIEAFQPPWVPAQFGGSSLAPCGVIAVWRR